MQSEDSVDASRSESQDLTVSLTKEPPMRLIVGGKRTGTLSGPVMATDTPSRSRRAGRGNDIRNVHNKSFL